MLLMLMLVLKKDAVCAMRPDVFELVENIAIVVPWLLILPIEDDVASA